MGLQFKDIIQAKEDMLGVFTLPGGEAKTIIEIKKGSIFEVSGIDNINKIYYLIEESGPGAEIPFDYELKFTKINN